MTACGFVIPGDINLPTGGYGYDRRVLALLPKHGCNARHVALDGGYPLPSAADLENAVGVLSELPRDMVLLIDGLALGAMPPDIVARIRQPIVALCHHPLALEAGLAPDRSTALRASEIAALAAARAAVATSGMTRQLLVDEFAVPPDKITVAEPGTDPAARAKGSRGSGSSGSRAAGSADAFPDASAPLHLLAVGSVVPRKGYDILIRALAEIEDRNWQLTIAGADDRAPETTAEVRQLIVDKGLGAHCHMIGPVDTARLNALYGAADLFVMPSLFEGYGMVIAEAMVRGLPIVCTTGGAAAETAPDAAALKVPPGDVAAFRDAVRRAIGDASLRARMADASWAAGQRLPRWDDTARIIAGVINKVWA